MGPGAYAAWLLTVGPLGLITIAAMAFSLQARIVFPVDRPPIEGGVVTIEGERIVAIGKKAEGGEVIDLGSVALLPGLVNAHTHLEFSHLREPLGKPGMPLGDWIRLVIVERGLAKQSLTENLWRGQLESVHWGVTTIGDIATSAATIHGDITYFHEVIGFSRARAESAMKSLVEQIGFQQPPRPYIKQGISPHAPYTVSSKLLKDLVFRARLHNLPMAMHLAESREELELLRDGTGSFQILLEERSMWDAEAIPPGSRPLDYLRMLSEAPRALVIHGNYLDEANLAFLAAQRERMSLVYCPRTHAYFFHPAYPLAQALAAGVRVALGTDSRASNPDLSLLAEMGHVVRTHPYVEPHDVLRMGTLAGAEALGCDRDVGSITPGKIANLVAMPLAEGLPKGADDVLAAMFSSELSPTAVWVRGGKVETGVDE